jgi:hypothetical protein
MENLGNKFNEKNEAFVCEKCSFNCRFISDWNRHITTLKHNRQCSLEMKGNIKEIFSPNSATLNSLSCENCNKQFQTASGLWKHNKKCSNNKTNDIIKEIAQSITDKDELIMFLIKENAEFKNMIVDQQNKIVDQQNKMFEQQNMMLKVLENGTTSHSHNTTNSHNKAFNLQFFLNETCKDAMNITDFVESIKLQLSDLEKIGEVGYVEGISNIITTNLKAMDISQRPVHCTDKKRETMYVKDENQWSKEDDNKSKLRKVITKIADKNIKLLPQFREKYPEYKNSYSKISDKYDKMVIEAMTTDTDKQDKIIRNILNATTIEKLHIKQK